MFILKKSQLAGKLEIDKKSYKLEIFVVVINLSSHAHKIINIL